MKKNRYAKTNRIYIGLFVSLTVLLSILTLPHQANAAGETVTGGSDVTGQPSTAIPIDDIFIDGTGNDNVPVRLFVTSGTLQMSTTTGLTFDGPSSGSTIEFSGTRSNVNAALATLSYTRGSVGTDTLEIALVEPGDVFFPDNGHLYRVITSTLSWDDANTAANGQSAYGADGYLATMTTDEENTFIADRLSSPGWFGASDVAIEGDWKWVTGPESGTSFWSGNSEGSVVPGLFANWANGEPNDSSGEDCAQFLSGSGLWNDLPCTGTTLPAYVVEFGADGDLPSVESLEVNITVANTPSSPSAPTAVAGIESAEISFSAPNANGSAITGYTVTASPSGITASGASSPITITGLTGGIEYTFSITATNSIGVSDSSDASNAVTPTSSAQFEDDVLGMGRVSVPYNDSVSAIGFPESYDYSITDGDLPDGLIFDTVTGELSGTPTSSGLFSFTIEVTNGVGIATPREFDIEIETAPAVLLQLEFEEGANIENDLSVLVSGAGLEPLSEYSVELASTPRIIGSGLVSELGSFSSRVYIPRDLKSGSHSITLSGTSATGAPLTSVAWFQTNEQGQVTAVSSEGPIEIQNDQLALTGSRTIQLLQLALTLLIAGSVLRKNKKVPFKSCD